ncbi:hypothetical protein ACFV28_15535 [Streptomyces sp. NPDC059720]|uniref:hypothetical protein n=1 Tax=Streptomyces sp. NPDC059720 TaxID=3346924 RepID=UPI00367B1AE8
MDKNEEAYTIVDLLKIKAEHEERAAALRQAGQTWRMRFATIDYLNLPRIAVMPGTNLLLRAAEEVHLDIGRSFREQGATAGFFVAKIHPLFTVWDARATQLTLDTVSHLKQGQMVAFEQPMRARNTSSLPAMPKSISWENAPQLVCTVGERKVRIRFDSDWITTATPVVDLKSAARRPTVYAGLGQVVNCTEAEVFMSARVFGQPQTPESAMWDYIKSSHGSGPDTLYHDDFVNEFSTLQRSSSSRNADQDRGKMKTVALHYDEDSVSPGIERELFTQIHRVVPEFRRDVRVAIYSMSLRGVAKDGVVVPNEVAVGMLAGRPDLWKTIAIPELSTLIRYKNIAYAKVEGMSLQQADDLHAAMKEISSGYVGAVEVDPALDTHRLLYGDAPRYRLMQSDLRLLWSAAERALSGDDLEYKITEWEASGLFGQVSWDNGPGPHDAEIHALAQDFGNWLAKDDDR